MNPRGNITPHFGWAEAACKCGCDIPPELYPNVVACAQMLERVREHLGGFPLYVSSWYRCPDYQRELYARRGEDPPLDSRHPHADAADVGAERKTPAQVQAGAIELQRIGIVGGLGLYPTFTHLDTWHKRIWQKYLGDEVIARLKARYPDLPVVGGTPRATGGR